MRLIGKHYFAICVRESAHELNSLKWLGVERVASLKGIEEKC